MPCYTKKLKEKIIIFYFITYKKNNNVPWLYNAYLKYHLCSVHKWQSCQIIGPDRSKNGQVNNIIMEHNSKEWESERTSDQKTRWTDDFNTHSESVSVDCDLLYQVTALDANCETNRKVDIQAHSLTIK